MSLRGLSSFGRLTLGSAMLSVVPSLASAITIPSSGDALGLANTLFLNTPGLTVIGAELSGIHTPIGRSQPGIYANLLGTYGLPVAGIALRRGNVNDFGTGARTDDRSTGDDNPATEGQQTLLEPTTGQSSNRDVVQPDIEFAALAVSSVTVFATFGSDEFPDFVGSTFVDGFGLSGNGVNVAGVLPTGGVADDPPRRHVAMIAVRARQPAHGAGIPFPSAYAVPSEGGCGWSRHTCGRARGKERNADILCAQAGSDGRHPWLRHAKGAVRPLPRSQSEQRVRP